MATTIELTPVTRDINQTSRPIPTVDVAPAQNVQSNDHNTTPSVSNTINHILQTQTQPQTTSEPQTQSQPPLPDSLPPAYLHPPTYIQTPTQTDSTSLQTPQPIHPRSYAYEDFNNEPHLVPSIDENNPTHQEHEELPAYTPPLASRLRAVFGQQPGDDMIEVDEETLLKRKKKRRLWFALIFTSVVLVIAAIVVSQVRQISVFVLIFLMFINGCAIY